MLIIVFIILLFYCIFIHVHDIVAICASYIANCISYLYFLYLYLDIRYIILLCVGLIQIYRIPGLTGGFLLPKSIINFLCGSISRGFLITFITFLVVYVPIVGDFCQVVYTVLTMDFRIKFPRT